MEWWLQDGPELDAGQDSLDSSVFSVELNSSEEMASGEELPVTYTHYTGDKGGFVN